MDVSVPQCPLILVAMSGWNPDGQMGGFFYLIIWNLWHQGTHVCCLRLEGSHQFGRLVRRHFPLNTSMCTPMPYIEGLLFGCPLHSFYISYSLFVLSLYSAIITSLFLRCISPLLLALLWLWVLVVNNLLCHHHWLSFRFVRLINNPYYIVLPSTFCICKLPLIYLFLACLVVFVIVYVLPRWLLK